MSSEFTFGDNSDTSSIFLNKLWIWLSVTSQSIRSLRHWHCHDWTRNWSRQGESDWSLTRTLTGADKEYSDCLIKQVPFVCSLLFNAVLCESVEWLHGMDPWRIQRDWEVRTDNTSDHRVEYSSYPDCDRDRRVEYSSSADCGRDRRGEQISDWLEEYPESLLWGYQSVSWMSLCETVDPILCRLSDVLVKSTDRCTCTLCFQLFWLLMNTDDPHLKCHLKSQIILHICPHHHVVVLKLRCRRSCHNANKICAIIVIFSSCRDRLIIFRSNQYEISYRSWSSKFLIVRDHITLISELQNIKSIIDTYTSSDELFHSNDILRISISVSIQNDYAFRIISFRWYSIDVFSFLGEYLFYIWSCQFCFVLFDQIFWRSVKYFEKWSISFFFRNDRVDLYIIWVLFFDSRLKMK